MNVVKNTPGKKASTKDLNPFKISGVYLLNNEGIVLSQRDVPFRSEFDIYFLKSMLSAIKIYIKDSFHSFGELRVVEYAGFKILIDEGEKFFLVVIGKGDIIESVREDMKRIVESMDERYREAISLESKDVEGFDGIGEDFNILTRSFSCNWAAVNGDQPLYHIDKGDKMPMKSKVTDGIGEEIKIPIESIKRIDNLILSDPTLYTSREDFIKIAVKMKLRMLKGSG